MEIPNFNPDTLISELQDFQQVYDKTYWEHGESDLTDVRHVEHHLGKLIGKVATYTESEEHGVDHPTDQIQQEVIPDLLFWALHLSNRFGLRIEEIYRRRIEQNIQRLHPEGNNS